MISLIVLFDHGSNDCPKLISGSVQQVILDAKVGPPSYEKGLARDILSAVSFYSLFCF